MATNTALRWAAAALAAMSMLGACSVDIPIGSGGPPVTPGVSASQLEPALLSSYDGTEAGPPIPSLVTSQGPNPTANARDRRWIEEFGFSNVDNSYCRRWASTLWQAYADVRRYQPESTVALTSLHGKQDLFITEVIIFGDRLGFTLTMGDRSPTANCPSFAHTLDGKRITVKAETLRAKKLGDESYAFKITTTGQDGADSPTYVQWIQFGHFLLEVRLGTAGRSKHPEVNKAKLEKLAKAAYNHARGSLWRVNVTPGFEQGP